MQTMGAAPLQGQNTKRLIKYHLHFLPPLAPSYSSLSYSLMNFLSLAVATRKFISVTGFVQNLGLRRDPKLQQGTRGEFGVVACDRPGSPNGSCC